MEAPKKFSQREVKLQWIPVRNLAVVWPEAQRPYKEWWAKKIADAFDPEKFDPVKTCLPNGHGIHHICEGQHRVGAVRMLWGHDELVPCLVAQEADPARAAEIFLDQFHRSPISKVFKFGASVTAHRKDEVAINRIVGHCGYHVDSGHNQNTVAAVDALKFVYNKGPKILDRTLRVLRETWGGDAAAVVSTLLKGYGAFICEFSDNVDYQRLSEVMKKETPGNFVTRIKGAKETLNLRTTEAAVYLLLKAYNKGLPSAKHLKRKGE